MFTIQVPIHLNDGMNIPTRTYVDQAREWPQAGQHILANYDNDTILIYQAYSPAIGKFAVDQGRFGGEFKYTRMSWIKPNFLWMMYRSNWGQSPGQQVVLAIRLRRPFFDSLLAAAVRSAFSPEDYPTRSDWQTAVERSDVRLQWDPDHLPDGGKCERRAIQLGLRGTALETYGQHEIIEIIDMSSFVAEQRGYATTWQSGDLHTPVETVYTPADRAAAQNAGLIA